MRLEHHLVGGYVRYISPHIIIIIIMTLTAIHLLYYITNSPHNHMVDRPISYSENADSFNNTIKIHL